MNTSFTSFQVEQFRRDAERLAHNMAIPRSQALDQIAVSNGFRNWSLLVKHALAGKAGTGAKKGLAEPVDSTRFYVHGDQVDINPSVYYCAQCDVFVDSAHFVSQHGIETYDFALRQIQRWKYAAAEQRHRRPENAVNILELEGWRRHAEKEAWRSSFHHWLEGKKGRNDLIGDLAQDALRDRSFPTTAATLPELREYLQFRPWAVQALNQAWSEFLRTL